MKILLQLGIPIILGIIAAGFNWSVLSSKTSVPSKTFVRVNASAPAGSKIDESMLEKIEFQGDEKSLENLAKSAVSYDDRKAIFDQTVLRNLKTNDLVLWRDLQSARGDLIETALFVSLADVVVLPRLLHVGANIYFQIAADTPPPAQSSEKSGSTEKGGGTEKSGPTSPVKVVPALNPADDKVGPFRILSVGELVAHKQDRKDDAGQAAQIITIAVKMKKDGSGYEDPNVSKLLLAMRAKLENRRSSIYGVVLEPAATVGAGTKTK